MTKRNEPLPGLKPGVSGLEMRVNGIDGKGEKID